MKALPSLFVLSLLVIRRHDAAAWLLDLIGGPLPRWQVASLGWLFLVEVAIVCTVLCVVVLLWNWACTRCPPTSEGRHDHEQHDAWRQQRR
jgi:hypothetical protein